MHFIEVFGEDFLKSAVMIRVVNKSLFEGEIRSVEYLVVGSIFVYSMDHGLDCNIFVPLGTFTIVM